MTRNLEYYRRLPYERVMEIHEEDGERYFLFHLAELPAVVGDGANKDEALHGLRECFDDYVSWRLEEGLDIALPARALPKETRQRIKVPARAPEAPHGLPEIASSHATSADTDSIIGCTVREREAVAC